MAKIGCNVQVADDEEVLAVHGLDFHVTASLADKPQNCSWSARVGPGQLWSEPPATGVLEMIVGCGRT